MTVGQGIDVALKLIATGIAVFGVWRFFEERAEQRRVAREERSLAYIARFGDAEMVTARAALVAFWRRYPAFAAVAGTEALTPREYGNFVETTYPADPARAEVDAALFRLIVFYDEVAFCLTSRTCDAEILLGYFCEHATRHARVYAPFYRRLSAEIGSEALDRHLMRLADACPS